MEIARSLLSKWAQDAEVEVHGKMGGAFDMTEEMDSRTVLELLVESARVQAGARAHVQLPVPQCAQSSSSKPAMHMHTAPLTPSAVANNA